MQDNVCMARKGKKRENPGHFLREWREANKMSLHQVEERVREIAPAHLARWKKRSFKKLGATHSNLSRIENGKVPYSQILLEMLAEVYGTDRIGLLEDPSDPFRLVWAQIAPEQRALAIDVLRTFTKKTRTSAR